MQQTRAVGAASIPKRYILIAMCFFATFICYIDRVNISVAIIPMAEEQGWSASTKGLVLSAFFIGYMGAMIPTGWLANRIGGRVLMGAALAFWSLFTILTPLAAAISLGTLIVTRILMGIGEAASFPAIYNLFARWLPASERTRAVAINFTGFAMGTVFALSVSAALIERFSWQSVFYAFGAAGLIFALLWFRLVHRDPASHPGITPAEHDLLADCVTATSHKDNPIPWRHFLSHSAVWALVVNHFCSNWSLYLMLTWLPSYFRDAQNLSVANAGLFSIAPWIALFLVGNLVAWYADRQIAAGTEIGRIRKVTQITGLLGSAAFLLLAPLATNSLLALVSMCGALGMLGFCWSGMGSNHLDIAPRHADVLFSISNCAGTLPGIIGVALTGFLLDWTGSYTPTFLLAAAVNVAGAIVWMIWSSGSPLDGEAVEAA
jgi:MFS transporter, ACS family, solute carrier family 17 (sodium-dependent inorganic phosphate cotransporter), other